MSFVKHCSIFSAKLSMFIYKASTLGINSCVLGFYTGSEIDPDFGGFDVISVKIDFYYDDLSPINQDDKNQLGHIWESLGGRWDDRAGYKNIFSYCYKD